MLRQKKPRKWSKNGPKLAKKGAVVPQKIPQNPQNRKIRNYGPTVQREKALKGGIAHQNDQQMTKKKQRK